MRILLLHPPLLSPVVWRRLGALLEDHGHQVASPKLDVGDGRTWWRTAADSALATMPDADAVLAHSGAGPLAPVVVSELPAATSVLLIDAAMPVRQGQTMPTQDIRSYLASIAVAGVLPPWPQWQDPDTLLQLVPDESDRHALVQDAPQLPLSLYDVAVPVPDGWEPQRRGYLQLSPAYTVMADQAHERGWRTARYEGQHLDLLAAPHRVLEYVLDLLHG